MLHSHLFYIVPYSDFQYIRERPCKQTVGLGGFKAAIYCKADGGDFFYVSLKRYCFVDVVYYILIKSILIFI